MGIAKLGFSGLKYLFGKSAKTVAKTAEKVAPKIQKDIFVPSQKHAEFIKQTSIYDPNSYDFIHRLF